MGVASLKGFGVLLAAVLAAIPAAGQDSTPEPVPREAAVAEFVPVPRIPERAEDLQQTLRRISEAIARDPDVVAIETEFPDVRKQNELRFRQTEALLVASPTLDQLGDSERDWQSRLSVLASHRQTLARRASTLEEKVAELTNLRGLWSRSLDNARATQAPREVLASVETSLAAIANVAKGLQERRAVVLKLLAGVSEEELEASEAIQRISEARTALRSRLFEPDAEPLWVAIASGKSSNSWSRVRDATTAGWTELAGFAADRRRSLLPIGAAFVLSLLLAIYIRERMRRRAGGHHLEGSVSVFEHPISVAALATAFVAAAAFPFAPGLVRDLLGVVLLVPVIRLLTPVFPGSARRLLATLAGFYLVDRIRDVSAPADFLERAVFCGEMLVAACFVGLLLKRTRTQAIRAEVAPHAVVAAALRLAMAAFLVSFVANLFGYLAFAKLIGEGALGSIYLALLGYAVYRIGTTLVVVALSSRRLLSVGVVRSNSQRLLNWTKRVIAAAIVLFWTLGALDAFAIRDTVLAATERLVSTPLEVGTVSLSLGDVIAFPLTMLVAVLLSRALRSILEEDVYSRVTLRRGVANAVSTTLHYVLLLGGFFLALGAAGIDLGRFTLLAGAFGVGIGFGLQNVVNNFVSGLILLYERPVQAGDTIEVGGLLGEVKRIGIRASTVVTFQGAEVIVPNGNLLSDQLINWTLSNKHRRVEFKVGVAYGNKPSEVIEVLKRVLDREDRILRDPEPMVLFQGFGDSSLDFELRFWVRDYRMYFILSSDVASAVYDELDAAGISIPFPQRDLHLKSVDAAAAEKLRGREDVS